MFVFNGQNKQADAMDLERDDAAMVEGKGQGNTQR
jgi:hypothetical protein